VKLRVCSNGGGNYLFKVSQRNSSKAFASFFSVAYLIWSGYGPSFFLESNLVEKEVCGSLMFLFPESRFLVIPVLV